jgi:hypothetical protein
VSVVAASGPQAAASVAVPALRWPGAEQPAPLFPTSGLVLLLVLLAMAALAWWFGPRGPRTRAGRGKAGWSALRGARGLPASGDGIDVVCARRLDAQHRLYVVRWAAGELLLGVNGQSAPVVLDRRAGSPGAGESP